MSIYVYSNRLLNSSTNLDIIKTNTIVYVIPINSFNIDYETVKFNNIHKRKQQPRKVVLPHLQYILIWYLHGSYFPIDPVKFQQLVSVASSLVFRINTVKVNGRMPSLETCITSMLTSIFGHSLPQLIPSFIKLISQIPNIVIEWDDMKISPYQLLDGKNQILFSPHIFKAFDIDVNHIVIQDEAGTTRQ